MALRVAVVPSLIALLAVAPRATTHAQAPKPAAAPTATAGKVTPAQLKTSVDLLGSFDFPVRMEAGRTVRRAEPEVAVPVLLDTVSNAGADWYVRFRALVLLSGFNDPRTSQTMMKMLDDKHDRLRAVAYAWFEHHSDPVAVGRLLSAVDREETELYARR